MITMRSHTVHFAVQLSFLSDNLILSLFYAIPNNVIRTVANRAVSTYRYRPVCYGQNLYTQDPLSPRLEAGDISCKVIITSSFSD